MVIKDTYLTLSAMLRTKRDTFGRPRDILLKLVLTIID